MKTDDRGSVVISLASRRAALTVVHRQKMISTQLMTTPTQGGQHAAPCVGRNTATLLPFLDSRRGSSNFGGHLRGRAERFEHFLQCAHMREYASDGLSDQGPPMIPVTVFQTPPTISRMGRSSTPAKLRAEMAKRLMSARIVAGYSTKKQAADALGITLDRYEKWESGRTPVPAQYIKPVCELFGIDANYLYGVEPAHPAKKVV